MCVVSVYCDVCVNLWLVCVWSVCVYCGVSVSLWLVCVWSVCVHCDVCGCGVWNVYVSVCVGYGRETGEVTIEM